MKDRLKIFGENHAGTWTRDKEIETEITTRQIPVDPSEMDRRRRLAATEAGRAELRTLPPMETREERQELPFTKTYLIFTTDGGTCYCIGRDKGNPRREDYPVEVVGVRENPSGFVEIKAGLNGRATAKCARIRFADGFEEFASFTITQAAPSVKSETETLREMAANNFRATSAYLLKKQEFMNPKVVKAGLMHLSEKHTGPEIQKAVKLGKTQTNKLINQFYEEFPKVIRPTKKHSRRKVSFDDSRDQIEQIET
jgi:hypothetical protein